MNPTPKLRRKRHRNSRYGCSVCKRRKVKCTEELPECRNCVKHKVRCSYLDYTEEQLNELRQAKLAQEFDRLTTVTSNDLLTLLDLVLLVASIALLGVEGGIPPRPLRKQLSNANEQIRYRDHQHNIKQNFANLMPGVANDGMIYPVYTMTEDAEEGVTPSDTCDRPQLLLVNLTLIGQKLANGVDEVTTFNLGVTRIVRVNFTMLFDNDIALASQPIALGSNTLADVRNLYYLWLSLFIHRAFSSQLYYSCLINLTINYLVCNSFTSCPVFRLAIEDGGKNASEYDHYLTRSQTKNTIIMKLIEHYAYIIKRLRILLNTRKHPDLAALVLFILSLMSVYDPEATLHSLNCFRDGLFSILTYHINRSAATKEVLYFIPVHLRLMKNSIKLVYLPAANIAVLKEFRSVLKAFIDEMEPFLIREQPHLPNDDGIIPTAPNYRFIRLKLLDLWEFVNDVVDLHYPVIADNMDDMEVQQETLFRLIYKWVRFYPSQMLKIPDQRLPFHLATYLFYQTAKSMLFAVFPQVKFFFLRDFELPIMLGVFMLYPADAYQLWKSQLSPVPLDPVEENEWKEVLLPRFKFTAAYLIRCIMYFWRRLGLLYKKVLETADHFPIDTIKTWRDMVTNISAERERFARVAQVREMPIKLFLHTSLKREHYPASSGPLFDLDFSGLESDNERELDFLTLQPTGCIVGDWVPPS